MMRRKGIFTILAAVFMVLAFSAMAFAANQVFLKTTVPNIPKSTCWQAGTDTMEFDSLSNIAEGDIIEFTLNNNVTICKRINMFLTIATSAGVLDITGDLPVSTTGGTVTATGAGEQWGFLIQGEVGSQIIRLTLRRITTATETLIAVTPANTMTFTGTALTDKLVVKLFDGKVGVLATSGFQKQAPVAVADVYDTIIVAADNALCIDTLTQDYQGEYVQNTPNSIPTNVAQKLNFSGDYTIAHIMAAATLNLVTCKGAQCGNIVLGTSGQAASCVSFDYETIGNNANGYCTTHTAFTGYLPKFIVQTSQAFQVANYTVKAEILVNGNLGEHGVYWSSTAPTYASSATTTCGLAVGASAFAGVTYYKADGTTTVAAPQAPGANNCAAVSAAEKAVSFVTAATSLFIADQFFFELNLPDFVYNLAEVNAGDLVTVRVTLSKATCGTWSFDLCIGTFGCPTGPGATSSILCPYVTSLAGGDTYWNGLALVNVNSSDATVTITAYKADGTTASATESVPANGTVAKLMSDFTWTGDTPAGVPAYISASSSTTGLNGFVMMADGASNSMGYLCK